MSTRSGSTKHSVAHATHGGDSALAQLFHGHTEKNKSDPCVVECTGVRYVGDPQQLDLDKHRHMFVAAFSMHNNKVIDKTNDSLWCSEVTSVMARLDDSSQVVSWKLEIPSIFESQVDDKVQFRIYRCDDKTHPLTFLGTCSTLSEKASLCGALNISLRSISTEFTEHYQVTSEIYDQEASPIYMMLRRFAPIDHYMKQVVCQRAPLPNPTSTAFLAPRSLAHLKGAAASASSHDQSTTTFLHNLPKMLFPDSLHPIGKVQATVMHGKVLNSKYPVFLTCDLPSNYKQAVKSRTVLENIQNPVLDFAFELDIFSMQSDFTCIVWQETPVGHVKLGRVIIPLSWFVELLLEESYDKGKESTLRRVFGTGESGKCLYHCLLPLKYKLVQVPSN